MTKFSGEANEPPKRQTKGFRVRPRALCEVIGDWARNRAGEAFCDACVARAIGNSDIAAVHDAVADIGTRHARQFRRYEGLCSECGANATLISAARLPWA